jgi:hypothetical protein
MSVSEKFGDFNRLEEEVKKYCNEIGCAIMKQTLEMYDGELAMNRDRSVYRHKGKRKRVIKTIVGEVEYERCVYGVHAEDGVNGTVYLLDEAMGIEGSGFMSGLLSNEIVKAVCVSSYRNAARSVCELTGQTVSHTAAWNVVQNIGERVDAQEEESAALAVKHEGKGRLETKLLFEEQDGIWLKLQGKSRKEYGVSREMKLAIAYDGAKKTGNKRYELSNKVAVANFESVGKFIKRKEGVIAQSYNVDEIETRFLNGDGAAWIKQSVSDETMHFQLDPFHRNKAVRTLVKDPDMQAEIMELLFSEDIDLLLTYIEACSNSVENEDERQNLLALLSYFTNNKEGLVPCHRRGLTMPEPPAGIEYRQMGCMESNIFTVLGNRMKGRRACWSIEGGNNLARLLCLKASKKLSETLQGLTYVALPEKYAEEIFVGLSSAKVAKSVGKGYNGFKQMAVPSSMKWLKDLAAIKPLHEI